MEIETVPRICILFEEEQINSLFCALFESRGFCTAQISASANLSAETHLVTEPQYLEQVQRRFHGRCLVVGSSERLTGKGLIGLTQPLTETKINEALAEFLDC